MKHLLYPLIVILLLVGAWFFFTTGETIAPTNNEDTDQQPIPEGPDPNEEKAPELITTTDPKSDITFTYPSTLSTTYITAEEWPPRFVLNGGPFNCEIDAGTAAMSGFEGRTQKMNGDSYCIWERSEGAAGSVFRNYQISYTKNSNTYVMSFTLKVTQCGVYEEKEARTCQQEVDNFNVLNLVYPITQTATVGTN